MASAASIILLGLLGGALPVHAAINCTTVAIQAIMPPGATLSFASVVPENGTFTVPAADTGFPTSPINLPASCAIAAMVPAPGNTTFGFGMFLPYDWNGRTLTVGNGGLAGGVNWADMGTASMYGFATISTDTGHNSSATDATWAYNNTEALQNWGWRALHESVVMGKNITEAYYGTAPSYNYYEGCSTGGRQGIKEAEMFPDDFDGIVVGAPAWWTSHMQIWQFWVGYVNLISNETRIPEALFDTIGKEVLRQCDPQDGLVDNIVSDPYGCNFNPLTLLCPANVTNQTAEGCLTHAQINTFHKLTNDFVEANQTLVFPHWALGAEHFWNLNIDGDSPNQIGAGYIEYMLGLGADWDWRDFNPEVVALSEEINPGNATADDYDLSPFYEKGGKMIHYHGLSDGGIAAGASIYYYEQVFGTIEPMGIDVDEFYKFYLIPGMGHCLDTAPYVNAPYYIAGGTQNVNGEYSVPGFMDSKHDVLLAMMDWVENGTAPNEIIATAWENFTTHNVVTRQRPLCPYPQQAKYNGSGDANNASSWECQLLY